MAYFTPSLGWMSSLLQQWICIKGPYSNTDTITNISNHCGVKMTAQKKENESFQQSNNYNWALKCQFRTVHELNSSLSCRQHPCAQLNLLMTAFVHSSQHLLVKSLTNARTVAQPFWWKGSICLAADDAIPYGGCSLHPYFILLLLFVFHHILYYLINDS